MTTNLLRFNLFFYLFPSYHNLGCCRILPITDYWEDPPRTPCKCILDWSFFTRTSIMSCLPARMAWWMTHINSSISARRSSAYDLCSKNKDRRTAARNNSYPSVPMKKALYFSGGWVAKLYCKIGFYKHK